MDIRLIFVGLRFWCFLITTVFYVSSLRQTVYHLHRNLRSPSERWRHRSLNRHLCAGEKKGLVWKAFASDHRYLRLFHSIWSGFRWAIKKAYAVFWTLYAKSSWENISNGGKTRWLRGGKKRDNMPVCQKYRLSLIVRVNVVLNRSVVVDSDWRFDNLYGSHLQGQSELSTTTVPFRTTFTRTIKLNLLLK